jgi:BirA family biotin operon repressor/biotin-[acetyl-CoA-carboxylase] ligase
MEKLDAGAIVVPGVQVEVVDACGSTNSVLMERARPGTPTLLAAEAQTAGRGRRGRRWYGAPGRAITFSLARTVRRPARELAALSLVAGVAAARSLRALGAPVSLKWPNDLVADGAKLGGILVETRAALAVIGIGINYLPDRVLARRVRRRVASLAGLVPAPLPSRNAVIATIGRALMATLEAFEAGGLEAVRADWLALDAYAGRRLRVRLADGRSITGVSAGLAEDGGLRLRTRSGMRAIRSGTVRPVHDYPAGAA